MPPKKTEIEDLGALGTPFHTTNIPAQENITPQQPRPSPIPATHPGGDPIGPLSPEAIQQREGWNQYAGALMPVLQQAGLPAQYDPETGTIMSGERAWHMGDEADLTELQGLSTMIPQPPTMPLAGPPTPPMQMAPMAIEGQAPPSVGDIARAGQAKAWERTRPGATLEEVVETHKSGQPQMVTTMELGPGAVQTATEALQARQRLNQGPPQTQEQFEQMRLDVATTLFTPASEGGALIVGGEGGANILPFDVMPEEVRAILPEYEGEPTGWDLSQLDAQQMAGLRILQLRAKKKKPKKSPSKMKPKQEK